MNNSCLNVCIEYDEDVFEQCQLWSKVKIVEEFCGMFSHSVRPKKHRTGEQHFLYNAAAICMYVPKKMSVRPTHCQRKLD